MAIYIRPMCERYLEAKALCRFLSLVLPFAIVPLFAISCAPPPPEEPSRQQAPIVGGTRGGNPAVVWLFDTGSGGMCTGSLIAPRVVLTAKHCVQRPGASGPTPPSQLVVGTGDVAGRGSIYRVASVHTTPGVWHEGGPRGLSGAIVGVDVAAIVLTREVTGITPLPMMRANPRSLSGQSFTAVGYGQTPSGQAGVKYTATGRILAVDSNLIYVGAVICQGDSGGPIITQAGEIAGVASFGTGSCGTGYGAYNQIYPFFDLIDRALDEGGTCVASGPEVCDGRDNDCNGAIDETCKPLGSPCERDDECVGRSCRETIVGRICSTSCDGRNPKIGCDEGFYCATLPGECEGSCVPLGNHTPNLPIGASCNDNRECATLFCVDPGDGRKRCLSPCEAGSGSCIAGEVCANVFGQCGACVDANIVVSSRQLGEPCGDNAACSSGLCFEDTFPGRGSRKYCSKPCSGDDECGSRFHCRDGTCVAGRRGTPGEPCASTADCMSETACAARGEQRWCARFCDSGEACEDGFECVDVGGTRICVPIRKLIGDTCTESSECISGLCAIGAGPMGGGLCTRTCGIDLPCPTGLECRRTADGITNVCVWPPQPLPQPTPSGGGGCTLQRSRPHQLLGPMIGVLLVIILRRRTLTKSARMPSSHLNNNIHTMV